MQKQAVDFCSALYRDALLLIQGLLELDVESAADLDTKITLDKLTMADTDAAWIKKHTRN